VRKPKARSRVSADSTTDEWLEPLGEYENTLTDRSPTTILFRRAFLEAITKHAPEVLHDLRKSVLPAHIRAIPELVSVQNIDATQKRDFTRWSIVVKKATVETGSISDYVRAMTAWSERHGLAADWMHDVAHVTVGWHLVCCDSHAGPAADQQRALAKDVKWFPIEWLAENRVFQSVSDDESVWLENGRVVERPNVIDGTPIMAPTAAELYVKVSSEKYLVFCEAWDPFFERWNRFKARAQENFDVALRMYRDVVESRLKSTQPVRRPERLRTYKLFDWLVLWQCCRWTHARIAEFETAGGGKGLEESAIGHGIERAARSVGLFGVLRQGTRGRKRKNRKINS
jgi:hypothetical protein